MPRTRIDLPDRFVFSTEMETRIYDVNYGGHLGHDSVLALAHEARVRFLAGHGCSEKNVEGVGLIMGDATIVYSSEAFHGDAIRISIGIGDHGASFFQLVYLLVNEKSGNEVARVKTSLVFFDYGRRKTARMPEEFRKKVIEGQPLPPPISSS